MGTPHPFPLAREKAAAPRAHWTGTGLAVGGRLPWRGVQRGDGVGNVAGVRDGGACLEMGLSDPSAPPTRHADKHLMPAE